MWRRLLKISAGHQGVLVDVGRGSLLKRWRVSMTALKRAWPELFEDDRACREQIAALSESRRVDRNRLMALSARVSQLEKLLAAA
jgi:hypothetical protein